MNLAKQKVSVVKTPYCKFCKVIRISADCAPSRAEFLSVELKKKHARKNKYLGISEFSVVCQEIPGTVFSKVKCNIAGMVGLSISAKKDVSLHM